MKYKLLIIIEKDLIKELEYQAKMGFEISQLLEKVPSDPYSDGGWKMLLVKRK